MIALLVTGYLDYMQLSFLCLVPVVYKHTVVYVNIIILIPIIFYRLWAPDTKTKILLLCFYLTCLSLTTIYVYLYKTR